MVKDAIFLFLIVKYASFLDEFPKRIVKHFLLICPGKLTNFSTSIDLKMNAVACQLLRLFAAENDGDAILDLQIMTFFGGSMPRTS